MGEGREGGRGRDIYIYIEREIEREGGKQIYTDTDREICIWRENDRENEQEIERYNVKEWEKTR